jgi:hypothetical protein
MGQEYLHKWRADKDFKEDGRGLFESVRLEYVNQNSRYSNWTQPLPLHHPDW